MIGCGPSNEEQLNQIGKKHTIDQFTLTFEDGSVFAFTEAESEQLTGAWHGTNIDFKDVIYIDRNGTAAAYHFKLSSGFEMEYEAKLLAEGRRHYLSLLVWDDRGGFQADVWQRVLELDSVLDSDRLEDLYRLSATQQPDPR